MVRASVKGKMEERRDQPQWLAGPIGRVKKKKGGGREGGLRGESRGRVPRKGAGTAEKTGRTCNQEKG